LQSGDIFSPTPGRDAVLDTLPVGNYIVVETMTGLKFQRVDAFKEPGRMYGNINQRAERILNTFLDRPRTTGVLLEGEKGSGKSQLARNVSRAGYEMDLPTIIINAPFHGDQFNNLLACIEQPAIILMDEFEKVYNVPELQEQVLTLLDGMMTSQKLFILTVNNKYRVNEHMKNRPGRIFYSISFSGLESDFIREYCEDNLDDKSEIENVLKVGALFKAFNFDMLKALVEEMNRYKESTFDALELLNAKPMEDDFGVTYQAIVTSPQGYKSDPAETKDLPIGGDRDAVGIVCYFKQPDEVKKKDFYSAFGEDPDDFDKGEGLGKHLVFRGRDLTKLDVNAGRYEFVSDGYHVALTKKQSESYNLRELASY
jgi:hypothetical protein